MTAGATEFFEELGQRDDEPLLAKVSGRVRIELSDGEETDSWLVGIDHGSVTVSRLDDEADCTMSAPRALFDRVCSGEENAMACMLRGALVCSGDLDLLFALQRTFPGPGAERIADRPGFDR